MLAKYTAIIVEPRKHKALSLVLQNALECLSNDWSIVLFHGLQNKGFCESIIAEISGTNRIQLIQLQVDNLDQKTYSELFATRSILYDNIHTDYFLVFQTDSFFFKEHMHLLDSFLEKRYDYVGSPWLICNYPPTRDRGFVGNGGLSLRNTAKMLEIIDKHDWNLVKMSAFEWLEDLYFTAPYSDVSLHKPSHEDAKLFSVDEVFSAISVGCHKPWVHSHFAEFVKLHPEIQLLKDLQSVEE